MSGDGGAGPSDGVALQRESFERAYGERQAGRWDFHVTADPFTRYVRDRRLGMALEMLGDPHLAERRVLVACGGVGGEGIFLRRAGVADVTVSDISEQALAICRGLDPSLKTLPVDAEAMDLPDESFDVVVVQDGLHHLPRPVLGFTEMLRVARRAAIVIEPHRGLVAKLLGTTWERSASGAVNWVFRWDRNLVEQTTRSLLLSDDPVVKVRRVWDHPGHVAPLLGRLPARLRLPAARALYGVLTPFNPLGNMMVAVVVKRGGEGP